MSHKITPLDRGIADRIRVLREERRMSQPTVAEVLGVTYQSYQKIESGRVSFRAATIAKLARLFGVPVERLYGDEGESLPNAPEAAHVVAIMQAMSPDKAKDVLSFALKRKRAA